MKNAPGKTGQTPARTPNQTDRRDENVRRDQNQGRNPESDRNTRPQEPKRFEEQPIKPAQQPHGRGKDWQTTEDEDPQTTKKSSGRNLKPTDEKYLSEEDQYVPGRDDHTDEGPTESDERR